MNGFLDKINLVPHLISINYRKKNYYSSKFGLIYSCGIYILFIYFTYYFSFDFIYKTNPKINYKQAYLEKNISKNMTNLVDQIKVSGIVRYSTTREILTNSTKSNEERIPKFVYLMIFVKTNTESKLYECEDYKIKRINPVNILNHPLKNYELEFSINLDNNTKFSYDKKENGKYITKSLNFSEIAFNPYESKISLAYFVSNFSSTEYIYLDTFYLDTFFYNNFINDYDIYDSRNSTFRKESVNNVLIYTMIYQFSKIIEDSGFIISNFLEKHFFELKYEFPQVFNEEILTGFRSIFQFEMRFEKNMNIHMRVYKKLQNVLADLGGLFSSFLFFGNLILQEINKRCFDLEIINRLFSNDNSSIKDHIRKENNKKFKEEISQLTNFAKKFLIKNKSRENQKNLIKEIDMKNLENFKKNHKDKLSLDLNKSSKSKINYPKEENFSLPEINKELENKNIEILSIKNEINKLNLDSSKRKKVNYYFKGKKFFGKNKKEENFNFKDRQMKQMEDLNYFHMQESLTRSNRKNKDITNLYRNKIDLNQSESRDIINKNRNFYGKANEFINDYKTKKRNLLNIGFFEIFNLTFCCQRFYSNHLIENEKVINAAEKRLYECMDIVNFILLFENFEILKKILFNENQLICFDFFKLKIEDKIEKNSHQLKDDLTNVYQYFKNNNKYCCNNFQIYDEKIKLYIDEDFKKLLEI